MPIDPYALCPCGSGKKVKFCCGDMVEDMERIKSLRENNQLHMAEEALRALEKKTPADHQGQIWITTTSAAVLMEDDRYAEAKQLLGNALERHPDEPQIVALFALASIVDDGYPASQDAVEAALQISVETRSDIVSGIMYVLADKFAQQQKWLATRRHLEIALLMSPDEQIVRQIQNLDGNREIPFWFRSHFALHGFDEFADDESVADAVEFAQSGLWRKAAKEFAAAASKKQTDATLWYNAGLCHAWAGEEQEAAEALHQAAMVEADFEAAVEHETLAQLLAGQSSEDVETVFDSKFRVGSVSRLLANLEQNERFVRQDRAGAQRESGEPVAEWSLLDRPPVPDDQLENLTIDQIPNIVAEISIFDEDPKSDEPAQAFLQAIGEQQHSEADKSFLEAGGDALELDGEPEALSTLLADTRLVQQYKHFSPSLRICDRFRLERDARQQLLTEIWPNAPQSELRGKSPAEAAGDEELQIPLAAALGRFAAACDQAGFSIDIDDFRERLKLPELEPFEIEVEGSTGHLSLPQLCRLKLFELTEEQLTEVLNRAHRSRVVSLQYNVLAEGLTREGLREANDAGPLYSMLADLSRNQFNREETLIWIAKGREAASKAGKPLQELVAWDFRELTIRAWDPDDPELATMSQQLVDRYADKLPGIQQLMAQMAKSFGIDPPSPLVGAPGATPDTGLWTPGQQQPTEEKSKLWVPGQD